MDSFDDTKSFRVQRLFHQEAGLVQIFDVAGEGETTITLLLDAIRDGAGFQSSPR
jgi:hypothetical protein